MVGTFYVTVVTRSHRSLHGGLRKLDERKRLITNANFQSLDYAGASCRGYVGMLIRHC